MKLNIRFVIKYFIFVLNIIAMIAGAVASLLGGYLKTWILIKSIIEMWDKVCTVMLVVGVVMAAVAFIGCFGALLENKIMLYVYALSLIILAIAQTVKVVLTFIERETLHENIYMYELFIKNNATLQKYLLKFEILLVCLAMLIISFQVLVALASCYLAFGKRVSKLNPPSYNVTADDCNI